jgi:hypothetical protein
MIFNTESTSGAENCEGIEGKSYCAACKPKAPPGGEELRNLLFQLGEQI